MPKARSLVVAASTLARNLPEGDVNASRVVVGERSDKMSSSMRCRVGDREEVRLWALRGWRWGGIEDREGGSISFAVC